ncbi:MAG: hypothetical protein AABZ60_01445, partial [Planctomycetota bacterium]
MAFTFETVAKEVNQKVSDISAFLQYLEYHENPEFSHFQEYLQQQKISVQEYSHYLEQTTRIKPLLESPSTCSDQPEMRRIEKIGIRLIQQYSL